MYSTIFNMGIRRLSMVFRATCIMAVIFFLNVVDLSVNMKPKKRPKLNESVCPIQKQGVPKTDVQQKQFPDQPSGQLTLGAHVSSQTLLHPPVAMQYSARKGAALPAYSRARTSAADIVLGEFSANVSAKMRNGKTILGMGMIFQRVHLDTSYGNPEVAKWYPTSGGIVQLSDMIDVAPEQIYDSSLTFIHLRNPVPEGALTLCPMQIRSVFINKTLAP